jgi:uncharacterized integral membrane protein
MAWLASAAKARRHKTRKSAFGRFFFVSAFCSRISFPRLTRPSSISQFLPSYEGFNYNTGHFGAGNTVARRVIKPASPRNCRQETLFMKFIVWLIRVLVFVLLLVLALSNTQPATLNFLAGYAWSAPLILIGLAFFVVGLLAGLVSSVPAMVRLRMENGRLKRELRVAREAPVVVEQPPMPPLI